MEFNNIILLALVIGMIVICIKVFKNNNIEQFQQEQIELIKNEINRQYNMDIEAIRNLGAISKSLLTGTNYHNTTPGEPGTLIIPAKTIIEGDVEILGKLLVKQDTTIEGKAQLNNSVTIEGKTNINNNVIMDGNVTIDGTAEIKKDTTINGTTKMNNVKILENAEIDGDVTIKGKETCDEIHIGDFRFIKKDDELHLLHKDYNDTGYPAGVKFNLLNNGIDISPTIYGTCSLGNNGHWNMIKSYRSYMYVAGNMG
jgi:NDP-sugar pyrophosphorylase family protein